MINRYALKIFGLISIRGTGILVVFVFYYIVNKFEGIDEFGTFLLDSILIFNLAILARHGSDQVILREFPKLICSKDFAEINKIYVNSILNSFLISLLLSVGFLLLSKKLASFYFTNFEFIDIMYIIISIFPMTLIFINTEVIKSFEKHNEYMLISNSAVWIISIILYPFVTLLIHDNVAIEVYIIAINLVALLSFLFLHKNCYKLEFTKNLSLVKHFKKSIVLISVGLGENIFVNIQFLVAPIYISSAEFGVYRLSFRIAMLLNFVIYSINCYVAPVIAKNSDFRNIENNWKLFKHSILVAAIFGIFSYILLYLLSPYIMKIYGTSFLNGINSIRIIGMFQLIIALMGPTIVWIVIFRNEILIIPIYIVCIIIHITLIFIMVPIYNLTGLALSFSIANFLLASLFLYITIRSKNNLYFKKETLSIA